MHPPLNLQEVSEISKGVSETLLDPPLVMIGELVHIAIKKE